jgi:thiamine pyrophosphate-dependent acetolactate synthase large subunit-like protein
MKGKSAVAKALKMEGVDFITGFPSNALLEAVAQEGIRTIQPRTERVAINIADGFTRASFGERHGVSIMQYGPGIENSFAGVAHAFADSVPILLLPGAPERRRLLPPNFIAMFNYREITKWVDLINFADRVPEMMRRAFHHLKNGRPAPVMLELPVDVAEEEFDDALFRYTPARSYRSGGDPADVKKVAQLLLKAECPVIRAGQGVHYARAWRELRELVELLQIPIYTTMNGKSAFPESHPLSLGTGGRGRPRAVLHFHEKADLIFAIGSSCTIEHFTTPIPAGKRVVQSTIDERDLSKDYPLEHAIIGDAKLVLRQLIDEVKSQLGTGKRDGSAWSREIKEVKTAWLKDWMPKLTSDEIPINPYRIVWDMMQAFNEKETIVTHDSGNPREQLLPFYVSDTPGSYIGWGKSTTMGQSLGLTMGAKLARPEKTCVHFIGDGSFGMVGMDFETAVREQIPIITIVLHNSTLSGHAANYPTAHKQYRFTSVSGDYAKIAAALRGYSEVVRRPEEIIPALQRAKQANKKGMAALVEVVTRVESDYSK